MSSGTGSIGWRTDLVGSFLCLCCRLATDAVVPPLGCPTRSGPVFAAWADRARGALPATVPRWCYLRWSLT
jgi:hypothetical protein